MLSLERNAGLGLPQRSLDIEAPKRERLRDGHSAEKHQRGNNTERMSQRRTESGEYSFEDFLQQALVTFVQRLFSLLADAGTI